MASDWRRCTIADLCDIGVAELQTGPFGSQLHAYDYIEEGIPVVPTEAIRDRRIDHAVLPKISAEKARTLERHRLRPGDILFARRGVQATGHSAYVRTEEEGFICGTGAIRLRVDNKSSEVDSEYLSHVFANSASVDWFKFHAIGATMPNLNEGIVRSFPLDLPSLPEQRAIAHILGTLDDKIDLNRRMNETLEAMARALFKSWFVDFDPVRRNAARASRRLHSMEDRRGEGGQPLPSPTGRRVGDEGVIVAQAVDHLFPDRFVPSELGEVPEGWSVGSLGDLAVLNPEVWSKDAQPDLIDYVDLSNTKWGRIESIRRYKKEDAPSRAQRVLRAGDTIVGTVRPGNGSYALIFDEGLTGSTGFAVMRPTMDGYREYVYLAATTIENIEALAHLADGAAYPAVRPQVVALTPALMVSEPLFAQFSKITGQLLDKMAQTDRESRALAALRDALLSPLISGELRISSAERIAARCE